MLFTIFGLGKKNSPYFPFHNVGRSVIRFTQHQLSKTHKARTSKRDIYSITVHLKIVVIVCKLLLCECSSSASLRN